MTPTEENLPPRMVADDITARSVEILGLTHYKISGPTREELAVRSVPGYPCRAAQGEPWDPPTPRIATLLRGEEPPVEENPDG